MKRNNGLFLGMVVIATALAYLLDYASEAAKKYVSSSFDTILGIFFIIAINLIFAGILLFVLPRFLNNGVSPGYLWVILLLGLVWVALPFSSLGSWVFISQSSDYSRLIGALWVVAAITSLVRKKEPLQA